MSSPVDESNAQALDTQADDENDLIEKVSKIRIDESNDEPIILCDLGYGFPREAKPRREKILAIAKQMINFLEWQHRQKDMPPIKLHFVSHDHDKDAKKDLDDRMRELWLKSATEIPFPDNLEYSTEPLEAYQDAVYLSPDAEETLDGTIAPPKIMVVGLLIDRRIQLNRSLERASKVELKALRWPIESVVNLDRNEPLNVDCVLEGMQQWHWNYTNRKEDEPRQCLNDAIYQAVSHHHQRHPERPRHKT